MEQLTAGDPQHIGGYRLLGRLGSGGMGQVYLARSDRGRTVAVKLVRRELAEQEEFRNRFRQEVSAMRRVGGAWTAPLLDADTEADVPWVATGYVAGPALHSVVSRGHGPLPERTVRILASGLAHALCDIHAAGIVHRDLKPSNVLLTIDGPRLIDFGIARALDTSTAADGSGAGGLTHTGALVGSPGFMSPEQVRGERVTPAADVFCLGSVLAYAATGRLPFGPADSGIHAQLFRIVSDEPDLTGVPEGLLPLIRDCLRKDPAERPTVKEILERTEPGADPEPWLPGALVAELGRHAVQLLEAEQPTAVVPPTAPPPAERPRRRGATAALAALATAVAVAVGTGVGVYAFMDRDDAAAARTTASGPTPGPDAPSSPPPHSPVSGGAVPESYVGTWEGSFETADGVSTRTMTIVQGQPGEQVMTLVGKGPNHDCRWSATLTAPGPPLVLGPTKVASGDPRSCAPGQLSRLELSADSMSLVRELVGTKGVPITYTKRP
ncbi:serine/threonine-protein kinase [Streptomyces sp. PR69]|uniref:serine/threonine-protein kinase n=1 Tax=Streptomyces sp. PR69 TaxID=2984950 RepID=UPI0022650F04|nr:serine/threonine-protein kinase [Streptomyces sp. PR69]